VASKYRVRGEIRSEVGLISKRFDSLELGTRQKLRKEGKRGGSGLVTRPEEVRILTGAGRLCRFEDTESSYVLPT